MVGMNAIGIKVGKGGERPKGPKLVGTVPQIRGALVRIAVVLGVEPKLLPEIFKVHKDTVYDNIKQAGPLMAAGLCPPPDPGDPADED